MFTNLCDHSLWGKKVSHFSWLEKELWHAISHVEMLSEYYTYSNGNPPNSKGAENLNEISRKISKLASKTIYEIYPID